MGDTSKAEAAPDHVFNTVEQQYMPAVLQKIRKQAEKLAKEEGRTQPNYVDSFRAFEEMFAGHGSLDQPVKQSWYRENIFLLVAVAMTIIFGLMGLLPYWLGSNVANLAYKPDVYLDISKLFAGVVVGGAAGIAGATGLPGKREKT